MLLVCTRMLLVCFRMLLVCTRMLLVWTRVLFMCTHMYTYVTRMYSCCVLVTIVWMLRLFFHTREVAMFGAIVFCFLPGWFYTLSLWKNNAEKNSFEVSMKMFDCTIIAQKGSSDSELYSCWDSVGDGFADNWVVDKRKLCKNRNKYRQLERNSFCKIISKYITPLF